jgi:16S rRNA C967 or C1407 C5-methylase (RsmB/RsmF family)/NOL1/NOP2/fmu family ribosome biogenesis protein
MFPEKFIKRIKGQEYADASELLKALEEPSPVSIRINLFKWDKMPAGCESVPWSKCGYYLGKRPSYTLDPLFHAGCYYPQEASGMFIEQIFKQTVGDIKGIRVLDLCGAPGGKSTHLSSMIGKNGFLVANDVIRARALILAENLTKWGLSNAIVTQNDPAAFSRLKGFFDLILIDAPCSGEGMFRDQVAVTEWSEDNTLLCSDRQKRILIDVWPALKENGILIYSTCTFNPDENEKNIKWLTEKHDSESVKLNISDYSGITEIDHLGIKGYGFYPGKIRGEGLFISVIKKEGNSGSLRLGKTDSSERKISRDERKIAADLTDFKYESLLKINDEISSIPCSYNDYALISKYLKVIRPGTKICTLKRKNYIPSHELALSVYLKKSVYSTLNLNLQQALNYLRRENQSVSGAQTGWIMAAYQGVNLGFLNNIGNRMNNYYPVEWRIRMRAPERNDENSIKWIGNFRYS